MEEQKKQVEQPSEEELKQMDEEREQAILWSGDRTIKGAYSQISDQYSDLAKRLEASGKSDLVESANAISLYYRIKASRVETDGKLSDKIQTPGWMTMWDLSEMLKDIPSEKETDQKEDSSSFYGFSASIIRETGKFISDYLESSQEEESASLFPESPSIFPEAPSMEDKDDYFIREKVVALLSLQTADRVIRYLRKGIGKVSPKLNKRIEDVIAATEGLNGILIRYLGETRPDTDLKEAKIRFKDISDLRDKTLPLLIETTFLFEIKEINGKERIIEYKSEDYPTTALEALKDLEKIGKSSKGRQINISKDLLDTMISSKGDTLSLIQQDQRLNEEQREKTIKNVQRLQKQGKLLRGTMEGLSGGKAYFKIFTIALAQTLNEQIKFYKTEESGSGLPLDLARKYIGQDVELKTEKSLPVFKKGYDGEEKRSIPYILISYEDLAKKMKGTNKVSGGKDSDYIRDYIDTLQNKEYLLSDGKGGLIGLPFIHREVSLYLEKNGKEVGCILRLSPQFSKTCRGYSALRSDTIKRLGGGQQKDITMNLLDILIYTRGISSGGKDSKEVGEFRKSKEDLLSAIATNKRYERSKQERERDFQEAVQKAKNSLIISKYREEQNSGGETISVFTFSRDSEYFKGEEIPEIEEQ